MSLPLTEPCYAVRRPGTNEWHVVDVARSPLPPYRALCGAALAARVGELLREMESPRCPACVDAYRAALGGPR